MSPYAYLPILQHRAVAPVAWEIGGGKVEERSRDPPAGLARRRALLQRRAADAATAREGSARHRAAAPAPAAAPALELRVDALDAAASPRDARALDATAAPAPTTLLRGAITPLRAPTPSLRYTPLCQLLNEATAVRALAWVDAGGGQPLLLVGTNARKLRVVHAPDGVVASEREGHHGGALPAHNLTDIPKNYRYSACESCSQFEFEFDSLPLPYCCIFGEQAACTASRR